MLLDGIQYKHGNKNRVADSPNKGTEKGRPMQYDIENDGGLFNVVLVNNDGEIVATVMVNTNKRKAHRMVDRLNNNKRNNKRKARSQARRVKAWEYVAE
jgi:hypothetical protein